MANTMDVKVPDIGNYADVPVIEVLVAEGESVEAEQPLIVLESDKATLEVPAPAAGVVHGIKIKVGDKVSEGHAVCTLELAGEAEAAPAEPARPAAAPAAVAEAPTPAPEAPAAATPPVSAPAAAPASGATSTLDVRVPDIGNYSDVPVIEVLVADGDAVEAEQPLIVLESDKATLEVPAPAAGIVRGLKVKAGDKLSEGNPICSLETTATADATPAAPAPAAAPPVAAAAKPSTESQPWPVPGTPPLVDTQPIAPPPKPAGPEQVPYAGPATRKFARELGVDLAQVPGTGPRGRILVEDVQTFVKNRMTQPATTTSAAAGGSGIPPIPAIDFSKFGPIESKPLARIRKLSAQFLHRSWVNVPHVTQTDEADITELEAFRKSMSQELVASGGPKLTVLPFLIKAVAVAMRTYPEFNASLAPDGESLIMKGYCNIGFAADTPNGLVVPVIKDVWNKGIAQLAEESAALAKKARDGKLKPDEMQGGCFSISSLGGIGGSFFTPIVNAPEVGILGVSKAQMKPVWDGSAFQPRLMCPLSLSYDHRVIDGAYAARFIVHLGQLIGDLRRLAL
ncbi:dihydrolipoyllysine-residue acetyltransferase [Sinimarinibacterium sp. CAU 1509]|uniref:dihydrolipoyllysine-residue acetyltransferase n=1 Tax=Sinimarinibacterium sp. CAU 1509 TaxID=2562283 RepID=UPI0010ACDEDE|nr:dihydrolipoyllysine-residue acetyltransferase [Sinimarinibacterium sp. CAU 1509]TJY63264.1 dihydrolipoyllysine-residue acetyltransferase [Sinimarinibacterium sp. CAU 1509]